MKTFRAGILAMVLGFSQAVPLWAGTVPSSPSARLQIFETCAGRLSAEIAHRWLVDPASADPIAEMRDEFDAVIEAVLPDALAWGLPPALPMHWRVSAKAMQGSLLATATFSLDPAQAARARHIATAHLAACNGIVIG
jgi:hypothetical protein